MKNNFLYVMLVSCAVCQGFSLGDANAKKAAAARRCTDFTSKDACNEKTAETTAAGLAGGGIGAAIGATQGCHWRSHKNICCPATHEDCEPPHHR